MADQAFDSSEKIIKLNERHPMRKAADEGPASTGGGGGGTYEGMDARITALETHFEYVRRDLDELKVGQGETHRALADVSRGLANVSSQMIIDKAEIRADLAKMPTRSDLTNWKLQWMAIAFAMIAVIVGGIIGGLSWLAPAIPPATP